jgi:hypothetical protein
MLYSLLQVGEFADIERRQAGLPTQHNIPQTVTPLLTGRWTAGIDARLQMSSQANTPDPNCTLAICTGVNLCGAARSIGVNWVTYQLKVQLRANDVHTISFVTTCSSPAYVALRNLVIPGSGSTAAPVTSTLVIPTTLPAQVSMTTVTESLTLTETLTSPPELLTVTVSSPPELSTVTVTQVSTATETQALPSTTQPSPGFSIRYNWDYGGNDDCGDGAIVLVSAPNNPDFMILNRNNYDEISIDSANYSLTLTLLNGRKLCTYHGFDEYEHRDWEGVPQTIEMREQRDGLNLRCPHSDGWPVDPPDQSYGTSNIFLQIDTSCPNVIKQIGCSRYFPCTVDAYSSTNAQPISFVYPFNEWLRFKAVGTGWTKAYWTVSYGGLVMAEYTQHRGERIDIAQNNALNNVGDVQVAVNCRTVREVQVINYCQFPILLGKSSVEDLQILEYFGTSSLDLDQNELGVLFTPLDGQYLCAQDQQTSEEICGYDTITVGLLESMDLHSYQLECSNGVPSSLDISGPGIPLEVRGNILDRINLVIQIGCEPNQPCNAIHLYADIGLSTSTTYPITSPMQRLRVKAFGADPRARLYFAVWSVDIPDKPTATLTQENGQWMTIDVPADASSISLSVAASYDPSQPNQEPTEDPDSDNNEPPPPARLLSLGMSNFCTTDSVIIGNPSDLEYFVLGGNSGAGFSSAATSNEPRLIFEPPSGRQLCASLDRTSLYACGVDSIVARDLADGDDVQITCPGNGPPRPDAATTIPASIGTTNTSPNLAVQVGCEPGNYCLSRVRSGYGTFVSFDYPILSPMARFRVRIFAASAGGQVLSYVEWQVGFSGSPQTTYYQAKGQWFEVLVPADATSIEISGNAVQNGEMPAGPTSMRLSLDVDNTCSGAVLVGILTDPEYIVIPAGSGASFNRGVTANGPRLISESLSTRQICAVLDRAGVRQCGVTGIEISGLIDNDGVRIECADTGPPAPDTGVPIPVLITTSANIYYLVAQIGCEPGNYCLSHENPGQAAGNDADIVFDYPMLSPVARLRVRIIRDAGGVDYQMAEWRVGFSGGVQQTYNALRADWFEIAVPSDATSIEIQGYTGPSGDPSS